MRDGFQTYKVNVEFTYDGEVFNDDPDDVFELASLEEKVIATELHISFPSIDISSLTVSPVIGD